MTAKVISLRTLGWCRSRCLLRLSRTFGTTNEALCSTKCHGINEPPGGEGEGIVPPIEKFAYGKNSHDQRDRNAPGLFYLNTVRLPQELEENLTEFLNKHPRSVLEQDGLKLSKHLKNRGRPTDRTWRKFKEARTTLKSRARAVDETQVLKWENEHQNKGTTEEGSEDDNSDTDTVEETGKGEEQDEKKIENKKEESKKDHKKSLTRRPREEEYKVIRYGKREAAAFASSRIQASYGSTLRVLHEIARREPDFKPETVLDFGSGAGTAVWAAHEKWGDSIKEYQCVDVSEDMNSLAEFLLRGGEGFRNPLHIPRVYFKRFLPVSNKVTYDVVVASFSLSELPRAALRQVAISSLWGKTNDFLVIIEYGNNEGFDITLEARKLVLKEGDLTVKADESSDAEDIERDDAFDILNSDEMDMDDGHVFAPCPHDTPCPRDELDTRDHPCNFEQRVPLALSQKNTGLRHGGIYTERFSYLVLRKGRRDTTEESWPRILRPVRKRRRHIVCNVCSSDGTLKQKILTKRKNSEIYKCARHLNKWGDLLPMFDPKDQKSKDQLKTSL